MKQAGTALTHAEFSPCRKYRYSLSRIWDDTKPFVMFIGLNPSTADEFTDDPTIRRCRNYAESWGYGGIYMANLFALRSTDPKALYLSECPVQEYETNDNNDYLMKIASKCKLIVFAWGVHGDLHKRGNDVIEMFKIFDTYCLAKTQDGFPKHPLYLKKDLKPMLFKQADS